MTSRLVQGMTHMLIMFHVVLLHLLHYYVKTRSAIFGLCANLTDCLTFDGHPNRCSGSLSKKILIIDRSRDEIINSRRYGCWVLRFPVVEWCETDRPRILGFPRHKILRIHNHQQKPQMALRCGSFDERPKPRLDLAYRYRHSWIIILHQLGYFIPPFSRPVP
jgi:hypothetical protein